MSRTLVLRTCAVVSPSPGSPWLGSALSSDTEVQQNLPPGVTGPMGTPPPLKGNVGQVAFQAGHLCPYLTRSPCIADAFTSPRVICIHNPPSGPKLLQIFFKTTQKKKKRGLSTHSLSPPPFLADLARFFLNFTGRVNRFTVSC